MSAKPASASADRISSLRPPAKPDPAEPRVDQPSIPVVGLDAAEPQVHLLGRVVGAGCFVGDVGDPGGGIGSRAAQPPGESSRIAALFGVAAERQRAAEVEVGPVAGQRVMGTVDVGDEREGPGRADDRSVGAVE